MSVIARFEIIPVRDGSMSTAIASALRALDQFPVSYQTTATDTIVEADTVSQIFDAVQAAHNAIPEDRVITSLEIDEDRRQPQHMHERVASVESVLGHPAQRDRATSGRVTTGQPTAPPPQSAGHVRSGQAPGRRTPPATSSASMQSPQR